MTDAVSICNLALQRLGSKAISNLTEDTTGARECNRVYKHARDSELRSHPWSFARTRVQIAADSTSPAFGYNNRYQLPADYVRMLPTNGIDATPDQEDFQIEGRFILTDRGSPINLVYMKKVTDENEFDALFTDVLVGRIAVDVAEKVTQSNTKKTNAEKRYAASKNVAKRINAFERPPQEPPIDTWLQARR